MGILGGLVRFIFFVALLTLAVSIACYLCAAHVLTLYNMTCFGQFSRYSGSKPFIEQQSSTLVAYVFDESNLIHERQTKYQFLQVYHHRYFGNILVIDGSLQITQRDEVNYHEMMVHVPMAYLLGNANANIGGGSSVTSTTTRALVIGGGDGGALSRLFEYPSIDEVHLVDIDMEAMRETMQSYFPDLHAAFADPRLVPVGADGNKWVDDRLAQESLNDKDQQEANAFDLIIVDSTDYGVAETLFTKEFYGKLKQLLKTNSRSILHVNLDSPSWNPEIVATVQRDLASLFKYSFVYQSHQPSFLSGHYSYLFVSDNVHPMKSGIDWSSWRKVGLRTHYYTPDLHYGSFMLPEAVRREVSMAAQLKDIPSSFSSSGCGEKDDANKKSGDDSVEDDGRRGGVYSEELERDEWPTVDVPEHRVPQPAQGGAKEEELGLLDEF